MATTKDADLQDKAARDRGADRGADKGAGARNERRRAQGYPADKRPTTPEAIERSDLPERDKQYGSDDN